MAVQVHESERVPREARRAWSWSLCVTFANEDDDEGVNDSSKDDDDDKLTYSLATASDY